MYVYAVILNVSVNLNTAHVYSVILNAAPSSPVILSAAQRSEESEIIANTPFTDFRFLAALGMTGNVHTTKC